MFKNVVQQIIFQIIHRVVASQTKGPRAVLTPAGELYFDRKHLREMSRFKINTDYIGKIVPNFACP